MTTNVLFAFFFFDARLWGLFTMQFVYLGLSLIGWRSWRRDIRRAQTLEPVHA